jgi:hypothetical protein
MPVKTEMILYGVLAAAAIAALVFVAASVASFLGVGVLGLLIMFIAFQVDLDKTATSSVYAMRASQRHLLPELKYSLAINGSIYYYACDNAYLSKHRREPP